MEIKLDIGSGCGATESGWLGVDFFSKDADIRANMWDLPYNDSIVTEIFSSHALEHASNKQIPITLKEWYRVLIPGGKVIIRVPDLAWCCNYWLNHQDEGWALSLIYGSQSRIGRFHKTGFYKDRLYKLVLEAGFKVVDYQEISTHDQKTLHIELTK